MSILNPRRLMTKSGRSNFLTSLVQMGADGFGTTFKIKPVLSVNVTPGDESLTDVVYGSDGLDVTKTVDLTETVSQSPTGKVYFAFPLQTWTLGADPEPQTVIGFVFGGAGNTSVDDGFVELDEPIALDEQGETLKATIEFGFDGQQFYVTPRVLPIGV